ncbi:hypothetical protein [Kitasatospora sp. NPDC088783]|uniref:hypothetical protein n=1 Tax=Kitasatospora sp. NPDC088783 TaxID=3364077 RepID=UPI00380381BD
MFETLYLDRDHTWRGRTIRVRPRRWFSEVTLDRDGYVETARDRGEDAELPPAFLDAIDYYHHRAARWIRYNGYRDTLVTVRGKSMVTLATPFEQSFHARCALQSAELDHDYRALYDLADKLALPLDDWLAPGERQLLRGVDFSSSPQAFLEFLRAEADEQGLRLNGRAEPGSVWVRPTLDPQVKRLREAHPEQFPGWTDRWTGHRDDAPRRPLGGGQGSRSAVASEPVVFLPVPARRPHQCPCGAPSTERDNDETHRRLHAVWAYGLPAPKNLRWQHDLAVVTSQSPLSWRKLAAQAARIPRREGHYDFSSWSHDGEPAALPARDRAYLLHARGYVVGFLAARDVDHHRWWDLEEDSKPGDVVEARRPRIDMIWTAATHRRHGIGQTLAGALAVDSDCTTGDISWSCPITRPGRSLARRLSPGGIWIS